MKYIIKIEGQEIELPEEIAAEDGNLKSALSPYFPGAANAKFMRSEPKDDVITVTVVKQAGTKGFYSGIPISQDILDDMAATGCFDPDNPVKRLIMKTLDVHLEPEDQVLRKLIEAPEGMNPVVELDRELEGKLLNQMSVEKLLELDARIDEITCEGREEREKLDSMLRSLERTAPKPSTVVMAGF